MPRKTALAISLMIASFLCGPVFAGTPVRSGDSIDASAEEKQPEIPKPVSRVEVRDNLLSVELADAEFGGVMNAIAEKAGIKVEITGDVYSKKLTTRFTDVGLERGILRLISLMKEKNYLVQYDAKGGVSKVEIYSAASKPVTPARAGSAAKPRQSRPGSSSLQPLPKVQKNPPSSKRILSPAGEKATDAGPKAAKKGISGKDATDTEVYEDDIPYDPSQRSPDFIPPRNNKD